MEEHSMHIFNRLDDMNYEEKEKLLDKLKRCQLVTAVILTALKVLLLVASAITFLAGNHHLALLLAVFAASIQK